MSTSSGQVAYRSKETVKVDKQTVFLQPYNQAIGGNNVLRCCIHPSKPPCISPKYLPPIAPTRDRRGKDTRLHLHHKRHLHALIFPLIAPLPPAFEGRNVRRAVRPLARAVERAEGGGEGWECGWGLNGE